MRTIALRFFAAAGTVCLFLGVIRPDATAQAPGSTARITGSVTTHTVSQGETLTSIGARFGVDPDTLIAVNQLVPGAVLPTGVALRIDNRHIVPSALEPGAITINVPQRMLFHLGEGLTAFPVAVGRRDWQTPAVPFTIVSKRENPTWHVPASILESARSAGRPLPPTVPPGPNNPLGKFWLGLSIAGFGIHGTNAPSSIYQVATHGCMRLHPDDIAWLFPRVSVGTAGRIVYEPILLAVAGDEVYLEVHPDVYRQAVRPPREEAWRLALAAGAVDRIDWQEVDRVIAARHGIARPVGLIEPGLEGRGPS